MKLLNEFNSFGHGITNSSSFCFNSQSRLTRSWLWFGAFFLFLDSWWLVHVTLYLFEIVCSRFLILTQHISRWSTITLFFCHWTDGISVTSTLNIILIKKWFHGSTEAQIFFVNFRKKTTKFRRPSEVSLSEPVHTYEVFCGTTNGNIASLICNFLISAAVHFEV